MKKSFFPLLVAGLLGGAARLWAADPASPGAPMTFTPDLSAAVRAAAPAPGPRVDPVRASDTNLDKQVDDVMTKIKVKMAGGGRTEAAFTDEFKQLDALFAAHQGEKTDSVAQILLLKAGLCIEVIDEPEKGVALLTQIKTDYPATEIAGQVDHMIAEIKQEMETEKVSRSLKPGVALPEFAVKDLKDLSGQPLSLARFKGKVLLVDFWATWCGPCIEEMPNVIATYKKYHDQGFEIVGVSLDKDKDSVLAFLKDKGMTWPQYYDGLFWDNKLAVQYGVHEIPANYLLDGAGNILGKELRGPDLDHAVAAALKK